MTHWRTVKPSPHLAACDLDGKDVNFVILSAAPQEVEGEAGRKETCIVAILAHDGAPCKKTMVLNATNNKAITKIAKTPHYEKWIDVPITVYPTTTKLKGDVVECIRIRLAK